MTLPSAIALIWLIILLFRPTRWLLMTAFAFLSFGALAILPTEWTGGVTFLVGTVAFCLIIAKTLTATGGVNAFLRNALNLKYLGLLTVFTVIAVVGAFVLPKIFIGQAYVFPMRGTLNASVPEPLQPTTANITQSAYLTISFLSAVVFSVLVRGRNFARDFGNSIIIGGVFIVVTGLMDMVSGMVGASSVLDMFRNASYAFLVDADIDGVRRVVGLTPEASSYGGLCCTFFSLLLFGRDLFSPQQRARVVMPLAIACAVMAALSTSSTAYVSLTIIVLVYFWDASSKLGTGTAEQKRQAVGEFGAIVMFGLAGLIALISFSHTRDLIFNMVDTMLFKKTSTGSFVERTSWNNQGLTAFVQTHGMGIGVGAARTSNFFINILASTGVVGSLFFGLFMFKVFFTKPKTQNPEVIELIRTARYVMIPTCVMLFMAGTTPDYGVLSGALFGIAVGGCYAVEKRKSSRKRRTDVGEGLMPDADVAVAPRLQPMRKAVTDRVSFDTLDLDRLRKEDTDIVE